MTAPDLTDAVERLLLCAHVYEDDQMDADVKAVRAALSERDAEVAGLRAALESQENRAERLLDHAEECASRRCQAEDALGLAVIEADAVEICLRRALAAEAALSDVSGAIGTVEFMDPPDGGSVTLAEQVARMRAALGEAREAAEKDGAVLEFYAEPVWSVDGTFPKASCLSDYRPDCGDTARARLNERKP